MKISVLTLVYNAEKHIEKCVRSLFGQDYEDMEFVFVDDASTDRSMQIVERVLDEFPQRRAATVFVTNACNLGIAGARNVALDNASGDYVLNIDSDDWLADGMVSKLAAKAIETDADLITFDYYTVYGTTVKPYRGSFPAGKQEYIRALLYRRARPGIWLKLIRRELLIQNNIRFIPGMLSGQDFYLSPILAYYASKVVKIDEPLYYYLRHSDSLSYEFSAAKAKSIVDAGEKLALFFSGVPDAQVYMPMIPQMKIRNKIIILQSGGPEAWRFVEGLYDDIDYDRSELNIRQRVILWLHDRRMYTAMHLYRRLAKLLKRN